MAEKAAHRMVHQATVAPEKVFPEIASHPGGFAIPTLATLKTQATSIDKNYDSYIRQYVGLIKWDGRKSMKLIYCNYFRNGRVQRIVANELVDCNEFNPATDFIAVEDGGAGFWQVQYDLNSKTCLGLSINYSP